MSPLSVDLLVGCAACTCKTHENQHTVLTQSPFLLPLLSVDHTSLKDEVGSLERIAGRLRPSPGNPLITKVPDEDGRQLVCAIGRQGRIPGPALAPSFLPVRPTASEHLEVYKDPRAHP